MLKKLTLAAFLAALSAGAMAHGGATGIVKERMDQMVVLREAMKVLKEELALGGPYDAGAVMKAAKDIKGHSGGALTSKFPEGSLSKHSEALPAVWTDWDRFSALAEQLEAYAGALETSASSGVPNDHGAGMGMSGGMMMGSGEGHMMGGGVMAGNGPDPAHLARMPPMAAFTHISQTCSACHTDFRKKKEH